MTDIAVHPKAQHKYLTFGVGLQSTRPIALPLPPGDRVQAVKFLIEQRPPLNESWWSVHLWKTRRSKNNWVGAHGFVVDIDYEDANGSHSTLPGELQMELLAFAEKIPGNLFHLTPRGCRVVYILNEPCVGAEVWKKLSTKIGQDVENALRPLCAGSEALSMDPKVQNDLGRLVYAPNASVNGEQRQAQIIVLRDTPYSEDEIAYTLPEILEADRKWNTDNLGVSEDWPENRGECPMCHHQECFGQAPSEEYKWFCFSANHHRDSGGCGTETVQGSVGSVLDLVAFQKGKSRVQVLFESGYLGKKKRSDTLGQQEVEDDEILEELLRNTAVVDGTTTAIHAISKRIYKLEAFRAAHPRQYNKWFIHEERRTIDSDKIVFAPGGCSPDEINLYTGIKTKPRLGDCSRIVEHVYNMCGYDIDLAHSLFCWLAWPLKYPGTKMSYSIVIHGGQGTGKSLFFERLMMQIYGLEYAIQIGQTELESHYTGWLSQKLYVVCNEVASSAAERKHSRNRLKSIITDKWFAIEEKFMPVRLEENHANLVFLSNEHQPVLPDMDDRRYQIIRFDKKEPCDYYDTLAKEIEENASEFYQYLLDYDPQGYAGAYAKPYNTEARELLIASSRTPIEQFVCEWQEGSLPFPYICCSVDDLWSAYRIWCKANGYFSGTKNTFGRGITLAPVGRECPLAVTTVGGKSIRYRAPTSPHSDESASRQIEMFREAYNEAYIDYNNRLKI